MRSVRSTPSGPASSWRFSRFTGLFFDEFAPDSAWIRDEAQLQLPPTENLTALILRGELREHPKTAGAAPRLACFVDETVGFCAGSFTNP